MKGHFGLPNQLKRSKENPQSFDGVSILNLLEKAKGY